MNADLRKGGSAAPRAMLILLGFADIILASSKGLLDPPHMFFYRAFLSLLRHAERRAASRRHQRERPEARAA